VDEWTFATILVRDLIIFLKQVVNVFGITLTIKELSNRLCGVKISRLVFQDQSGPPLYCNDFDTFLTLKMSWI